MIKNEKNFYESRHNIKIFMKIADKQTVKGFIKEYQREGTHR